MKRAACFILLIFTLVQIAPAVKVIFCSQSVAIFNPDEEKNIDNIAAATEELKEKKDPCFGFNLSIVHCLSKSKFPIITYTDTLSYLAFDILTPPPNVA